MEHQVSEFLINAWASIFTLMLTAYVALDGFDLGIGILSLMERDSSRKAVMMEGLSGVWDANETWLVLLGGTLFGAFPLAYAAVLEALYAPVLLMLFALIFRGVAFEFRLYARRPAGWLLAFGIGSLLAALAQGFALGGLLGGRVLDRAGKPVEFFDWFSPFSVLATVLVINLYVLLGACYLLRKSDGGLLDSAHRWAWRAVLSLVLLLPIFIWCSTRVMPSVGERWGAESSVFAILASCLAIPLLMLMRSLYQRRNGSPFFWSLTALILAIIGLVLSHYPFLVPGSMTLHSAASSTKTLEFMLYAVGGLLPFILGYNAYQYYVFRGHLKSEH
ncbi:cytochrome d ubiquinol oxidase subunit II [Methylomicrobium sp. Wu6]|uniref:cytochrome d ubiquinol oxidase subunit II n=1 Tax=Methylomicrobium sp. Wu6 TaxID=3107928 RepID=UPI002DD63047|nr:cytochrome d ubiquinol oxidase subunit II [Methylomicrobium sp. Wu6]MEC4749057.1 cytochrome d ubiquinol oxidase subunit II [Methylomicrobium sp. Wu6]